MCSNTYVHTHIPPSPLSVNNQDTILPIFSYYKMLCLKFYFRVSKMLCFLIEGKATKTKSLKVMRLELEINLLPIFLLFEF